MAEAILAEIVKTKRARGDKRAPPDRGGEAERRSLEG